MNNKNVLLLLKKCIAKFLCVWGRKNIGSWNIGTGFRPQCTVYIMKEAHPQSSPPHLLLARYVQSAYCLQVQVKKPSSLKPSAPQLRYLL